MPPANPTVHQNINAASRPATPATFRPPATATVHHDINAASRPASGPATFRPCEAAGMAGRVAGGVMLPQLRMDPAAIEARVLAAEEAGLHSVWFMDHLAAPALPEADALEGWTLASFLAARTERIGLSTGILIASVHHPLMLAKRLATIDVLSGGRMRLGVGVGWMREELDALDVEFSSRGRRLDEVIDAMRAVWREDEASFHGEFFDFERVVSRPRPAQPGGVPIHIGGHSPAAARRAGRLGDGFQPIGVPADVLPVRLDLMRRTAEAAGRDPDGLELTLGAALDGFDEQQLETLRAQGATRIQLSAVSDDLSELAEQMWAVSPFIDNGTFGT